MAQLKGRLRFIILFRFTNLFESNYLNKAENNVLKMCLKEQILD